MTHNRECPKCGLIVEWTKGKKNETMLLGKKIVSWDALLICPEHGEFEPNSHALLKEKLKGLI